MYGGNISFGDHLTNSSKSYLNLDMEQTENVRNNTSKRSWQVTSGLIIVRWDYQNIYIWHDPVVFVWSPRRTPTVNAEQIHFGGNEQLINSSKLNGMMTENPHEVKILYEYWWHAFKRTFLANTVSSHSSHQSRLNFTVRNISGSG